MRIVAFESFRRTPKLTRWMVTFLLLWPLTLAACGGGNTATACSSTPTTAPTTLGSGISQTLSTDNHIYSIVKKTQQEPQVTRFWRAGIIVVTLVPTCGSFSKSNQPGTSSQITGDVQTIFDKLLLSNESIKQARVAPLEDNTGLPSFIALGHTATLFFSIQTLENGSPTPIGDDNLEIAVNVLNNSNAIVKSLPINIDNTLTVVMNSASPDWLSEGGGGGFTGGHPDGPPDEASGKIAMPTSCSTSSGSTPTTTPSSGPLVYVLDTAHPFTGIPSNTLPAPSPGSNCDLFTYLAASTQETNVQLADAIDLGLKIKNPNVSPPPATPSNTVSPAEFREHGLFVSALIRHIAPQANIRLIRALNDWGVGDLQALFYGFYQILNDGLKGAVVNMSLGVLPPPACLESIWNDLTSTNSSLTDHFSRWQAQYGGTQDHPLVDFTHCNGELSETFFVHPNTKRLYNALGLMVHELAKGGDTLVAASGNDSKGIDIPFGAELPAALCDVIAVGASTANVGSNWHYSYSYNNTGGVVQRADFSNVPYFSGTSCLSINPATSSLQISNGAPNHAVITVGVGICSLLLHGTNDRLGAPAGLALWQGTSFSAAIISGNLAKNGRVLPATLDETQPCG